MLLTSLPYALGYAFQGENLRFTGFLFGVEDGNSYIAKMLTGSVGAWSFRTPYTTLPQRGAPVFFPYLLLGKLAAPPALHEQLVAIYHLFRVLAGCLAILASYEFLALFVKDLFLRRAGTALVALGGGLGWLTALLGQANGAGPLALEFYSPESFGFLALFGLPHLALARALLLWGFVAYLKAGNGQEPAKTRRHGTQAGLCWLLASLAQPLAGLLACMLCGVHLLVMAVWPGWRQRYPHPVGWKSWRMWAVKSFWAMLFVAPWLLGNFLLTQQDTYLHSWMRQNVILSPPPLDYMLAYGLMLPFAVTGFATLLKREPGKDWFPAAWMLALPLLAYMPVNLQRRLVEGVWVAIVVLSLAAVDRYLENDGLGVSKPTGSRRRKWIFALAALLALPSTTFLLAGGFQTAVQPLQPAFRPAEEVAVFEQLRLQGLPSLAVLASYETGNALPAWTPSQVVIGHGPESAGLKDLRPRVRDFFSKSSHDSARIKLLRETGASHVFWGPAERALGSWDPSTATYLIEVYQKGDYSLYEVIAEKENDRKNGLFESVEPVSNR